MKYFHSNGLSTYKAIKEIGDLNNTVFKDSKRVYDKEKVDFEEFQKEIQKFYSKYYSGNIMSLVIYTNENLDIVEESVKNSFSGVKNTNIKRPFYEDK